MLRALNLLFALFMFAPIRAAEGDRTFRVMNAADGLADNSAQIVKCTKTGRIIISTLGNINFYDGFRFKHADIRQELQYPLPLYRGSYQLFFDHRHHLWVKNTNTLACLDLMAEKYVQNVDSVLKSLGCQDTLLDLFVDNSGRIWFLKENGLQGRYNKRVFSVVRDRNLQDVDVVGNQLLTFYDNGEVLVQDTLTGFITHRCKAYEREQALKYNSTSVLLKYGDGYFQIRSGSRESVLLFFDVKKMQWTVIKEFPHLLHNMAVKDNSLFLASEKGYWIYNIGNGTFEHIDELRQVDGKSLETDCNDLIFDHQGGLWIGTEQRGVLYGSPLSAPFKAYGKDSEQAAIYVSMMENMTQNIEEYRGQQANCKFIDSRGWIWVGTTTGLFLQRPGATEPVVFTKKDGLHNDVIHSVIEDEHHNIWVSTSCGITFFLIQGDKPVFVNTFSENDGVPNESFINCKAIALDDSTIVMQSLDHIVTFRPSELEIVNYPKHYDLNPKLSLMMIDGELVQPGVEIDGRVVIDKSVSRVKDITLSSDQNSITLVFSGLNYFRPTQTYYRVRVKGVIDEWKVLSHHNSEMVDDNGLLHLALNGLEPGEYCVELQVSMFPDVWKNEPYKWYVHVNEPWWRTTGLLVLGALILFGLLVANFFLYNRNTRMHDRRNVEEGDIIRKIRHFTDRCDNYSNEPFAPLKDDAHGVTERQVAPLSQEFIDMMIKIMPIVKKNGRGELTVNKLCQEGGVDAVNLYQTVQGNLFKSPRDLSRYVRLCKGADLLTNTGMTVEEIAMECGFYTPNYFIGNFFHLYKQTPQEYRDAHRKT